MAVNDKLQVKVTKKKAMELIERFKFSKHSTEIQGKLRKPELFLKMTQD